MWKTEYGLALLRPLNGGFLFNSSVFARYLGSESSNSEGIRKSQYIVEFEELTRATLSRVYCKDCRQAISCRHQLVNTSKPLKSSPANTTTQALRVIVQNWASGMGQQEPKGSAHVNDSLGAQYRFWSQELNVRYIRAELEMNSRAQRHSLQGEAMFIISSRVRRHLIVIGDSLSP